MEYLIGIAIGCVVVIVGYKLIPGEKVQQKNIKIQQLTNDKTRVEKENNQLKLEITRNRTSIDNLEARMDVVERRQDQADLWFGSVIRHSREQFSKEAVEEFLKEYGMEEEE